MAEQKTKEPKIVLERQYKVPLRKGWLKVPKYKRASKAVKTLKEFIARHMKLYDNDLRRVKLDITLNNEIRFKGMKKPPAFIKVKAKKFDDGFIRVELVEIPNKLKFKKTREEKKKEKLKKKIEERKKEREAVEKPAEAEAGEGEEKESEETKEKKESLKEEGMKIAEQQAKELKHVSKDKGVQVQRKALAK